MAAAGHSRHRPRQRVRLAATLGRVWVLLLATLALVVVANDPHEHWIRPLAAAVAAVDAALQDIHPDTTTPAAVEQLWAIVHAQPHSLAQYAALEAVQTANASLLDGLLRAHAERLLPVIYTPGVALACQYYGYLPRRTPVLVVPVGSDAAAVRMQLSGVPAADLRVVVLTDGERVLGLGDLGVWAAPIAVGKARLHALAGGAPLDAALPIVLDAGTDNVALRQHDLYAGLPAPRTRPVQDAGATADLYTATVRQLALALAERTPVPLLHVEDVGRGTGFRLLDVARAERWPLPVFNDDIQGTGAVVLAALLAAVPSTGRASLAELTVLIVGGGQAGIGIARVRRPFHCVLCEGSERQVLTVPPPLVPRELPLRPSRQR